MTPIEDRHPLKGTRYWNKSSPDESWDYIIVGSGMGGLTAASLLAEVGRKVLLLEQHYIPGGFTHAFARKQYVWDVGVHAIGEVTSHTVTGRLLELLSDGHLKWASLGSVYEEFNFPDGLEIEFPDTPGQFRTNLTSAFPGKEAAIDSYFNVVREAAKAMRGFYLGRALPAALGRVLEPLMSRNARPFLERSVSEVMAGITDDSKLQAVLTSQWGYYGATPSRAAFAIQALITRHFLHGAFYPVGGAQEIARCLTRKVAERGGWTRICCDVESLVTSGRHAVGVRLATGEEIRANKVILATGIGTAVRRLIPEPWRSQYWALRAKEVGAGPAHLCLYLGLKGDPRVAGASGANKWFYRSWDQENSLWDIDTPGDLPETPVLYTSFPSLKDPTHPDPDHHTAEVVTFVPWESFEPWQGNRWQKRGEDYEQFKNRLRDSLLEQILTHLPELRPMVDAVELSTPVSTDFFCRPLAGSIYGLEATPSRFANRWLRANPPMGSLYFAGSDVASGGVMGAMMGGVLAAAAAEPRRTFKLLRTVA